MSRILLNAAAHNPDLSVRNIQDILASKEIYPTQPPYSYYRTRRRELSRHILTARAIDVATLEGYADLLRTVGHHVQIVIVSGKKMKAIRVKAAKNIFLQQQLANEINKRCVFDPNFVHVGDIDDGVRYYGGFVFSP